MNNGGWEQRYGKTESSLKTQGSANPSKSLSGLQYCVERFGREEVLPFSSSFLSHPSQRLVRVHHQLLVYVDLPGEMKSPTKSWKGGRADLL